MDINYLYYRNGPKHQFLTYNAPHADKTRTLKTTTNICKVKSVAAKPTKCANIYKYPINAQLNNELDYIISNIIHV